MSMAYYSTGGGGGAYFFGAYFFYSFFYSFFLSSFLPAVTVYVAPLDPLPPETDKKLSTDLLEKVLAKALIHAF